MKTQIITEGKASLRMYPSAKISRQMEVFYNPVMKHNRDISIAFLNALGKKRLHIADPLAGSGIRSVRFALELKKGIVEMMSVNDASPKAVALIKDNLRLNRIPAKDIRIFTKDASVFLLDSQGFDYIDIDPFGSPNPFLDAAIKRVSRGGILTVTATDTAPLCGTYPQTCVRKYWASPARTELMHEVGLRILIRKVQLVGGQYEKALIPIYSYAKDHYMRCFFVCEKGRSKVDAILVQHGMFEGAGPIFLGRLWDEKLARKMVKMDDSDDRALHKFLQTVADEASIPVVGFIDLAVLCKRERIGQTPRQEDVLRRVREKGYLIAPTHFRDQSFRTTAPVSSFLKILRKK